MTETIAPVHKRVQVALSPSRAFRRFTTEINAWWPISTHSIGEDRAVSVSFGRGVGEQIVETLDDGSVEIWGTVLEWNPPDSVRFTWHPGREPDERQHVMIHFKSVAGGTEIELVHVGWEVYGDEAAETRNNYDSGWEGVLALFVKIL